MRLFVAINPPEHVRAELGAVLHDRLPTRAGLRPTRPERWHVTLAFLGEVDGDGRARLRETLPRAAAGHAPPVLGLAGAATFTDRVLLTGVSGDLDRLHRIAASVRAAAQEAGADPDPRPYRPHLTLARVDRPGVDLAPVVAGLRDLACGPWTAGELHLVVSRSSGRDAPARYETLGTWAFTGTP